MKNQLITKVSSALLIVMLALVAMPVTPAYAANCISAGSGTWTTITWTNCGGNPGAFDTVTIRDGDVVTLNTNTTVAGLTVGQVTGGTLTMGDSNTNRTLTVTGSVVVTAGSTFNSAGNGGNGLFVGGNLTNSNIFDMNVGISDANVVFNGAANQTIGGTGGTTDFNLITINNSGAASNNIVEVTSTNFTVPTPFLTLTVGVFKLSTGATINPFGADTNLGAADGFIVNHASAVVNLGNNDLVVTGGDFQMLAGTFNLGTGNDLFGITSGTMTLSGGTLNILGRFQMNGAGTTTINGATINLDPQDTDQLGNTLHIFESQGAANLTFSSGTVVIVDPHDTTGTGDAVQIVSGAGTKSFTGGTIQLGDGVSTTIGTADGFDVNCGSGLTLGNIAVNNLATNIATRFVRLITNNCIVGGNFMIADGEFRVNALDLSVAGNFTNNDTFTTGGVNTVTLNGTTTQTIGGSAATTFNNLTVNNANGVSLNLIDTTVNNILTFTSGRFTTGANKVILPVAATVSGAGANTYVFGNVQRAFTAGSDTFDFPIGSAAASSYDHVLLTFGTIGTGGNVTASVTGAACGDTNIDQTKNVNRCWTLTNSGTTFDNYAGTFNYPSGAVDGTATPANFIAEKFNGTWSPVTISGTPTTTSTSITGVTSMSDFEFGEIATRTVTFTSASQSSAGESGTMTITAQLSAVSGLAVTVPFTVNGASTAADPADYSITASPITIPAGSTTADITITIAADTLDENNETVIVDMGTPTNATQGATTTHTATITDDDTAPTVAFTSAAQSSAGESGTMTITAQLSAASGFAVTVPFTVNGTSTAADPADYSITASPITIPAGSTTADITITIAADTLDENNETVVVDMGVPTNATQGAITTHTATITDDDATPTVAFTSASQSSAGESGTMTVTAQLSAASGLAVTVPFTVNGTSTAADPADYSITASPITIPAGSTTADITITIATDALDENNETVVVDMGTPTNATQGATTTHTATITDDDTAPTVAFTSAAQSSAGESGAMTVTAQLSAASGLAVTVPFTVNGASTAADPADYSITASPITIPAGSTTADITITIATDALDENNETVVVDMGTPTNATQGATTTHTATITDDDAAGITVSAISGNTTEAGGTATFTIVLDSQPTADVVVGLSSNDTTEGTLAVTDATFTTANWNTPQTVTVTGVNDFAVDGDIAYSIVTATATSTDGSYSVINPSDINVTNNDNDTAGISVSAISGNTTEAGGTATFTIVLDSQPTANVVIGLSSNDTTEGTLAVTDVTFTTANWNTPQTVTVTGVNDALVDGDIAYSIVTATATSTDGNYSIINPSDVSVTNTDNDIPGVTVSAISGNTTEAGGTATFTIVLNTQPTADVVIGLSSNDTTEGTLAVTDVTFTTANWNSAKTVTVTGVDDALVDGDIAYSIITAAATSTDGTYNGIDPSDVSVTNTDNDIPGITVSAISGNTTEAGGTATFTIVLNTLPTADVVIGLSSNDTTEGTLAVTDVTFTTANWNTPQTVTVTGVDDALVDGNIAYSIVTAAATSTDGTYNGIDPSDVSVTNTDNDSDGGGGGGPDYPTFADVPINHWAWRYVEAIYAAGITGGCGIDPFIYCPTETVTRAQMAIFILRGIHGRYYIPPAATGITFSDVPSDHWAANWIEELALESITSGCSEGIFCPDAPITRAEMSVFLLRAKYGSSHAPPPAVGGIFSDVPSNYWAAGWIEQLSFENITDGCGSGKFCPELQVTRDQMAVFFQRLYNIPTP